MSGPLGGPPPLPFPAEQALAGVYHQVVQFIAQRARQGDGPARTFLAQFTQVSRPRPPRAMVLTWLGNVASETRMIRPTADPWIASRLRSSIQAGEARVPGGGERVWAIVVDQVRAQGLPMPPGPPRRY